MGISRQEYWNELPCPPPRDLPDSDIEPTSLKPSALADRFFTTRATWETHELASAKEQMWGRYLLSLFTCPFTFHDALIQVAWV